MSAVLQRLSYSAQVQALLREWVAYRKRWKPNNGFPKAVCWIDEIKGAVDCWTNADDYDSRIYASEMLHVDAAIRSLPTIYQHAIFVVYLNESGPAVWRSGKKPMSEIRDLCSIAEQQLEPILKARNVVY